MDNKVLEINNLFVEYRTDEGVCKAVNGLSLVLNKGESLGLVGETGAGKTTVALSIMRLIPDPPGVITQGEIKYCGNDILKITEKQMRKIRGAELSMIFQDPMTALNPIDTVGFQIFEVLKLHNKNKSKSDLVKMACDMMEMVGIPSERYNEYPHQFSGGMKQRIVIAMALACSPELLIADEPTTALDVTIQAQILSLMEELKQKSGTSLLLITHDLGVVAEMCQKVAVIYAGEIVEYGTTEDIYDYTSHPYTVGMFNSLPDVAGDAKRLKPIEGMMPDPINLPHGCKFSPRCPHATDQCRERAPELMDVGGEHKVRCFYPLKQRR